MGVKVELNILGVRAALNDPAVVADLERRANAIAADANAKARAVWPTCQRDPYIVKCDKHEHIPAAHVYTKARSGAPNARGCDFLNKKYGILASSIDAGK